MTDAPVIVVAGPTASGKSGLGMEISEEFSGTIINADSMQVYRDLRILTARPSEDDEARVPHLLYGYRDAAEAGSTAEWASAAEQAIAEVRVAGRRPILVGGTGLYLKTLMEGIAPVPEVPPETRERALKRRQEIGDLAFHNELATRDPEIAARLHPGDSQRLLRAWEVVEATGRPLSDWQQDPVTPPETRFRVVVLQPPREELYRNADSRFLDMLSQGVLDEVAALHARAQTEVLDPSLPIFKALGYPPLAAHLRGETTLEAAIADSQQQTRNYAKRQMTWLRNQLEDGSDSGDRIQVLKLSYENTVDIFSFLS
ncbi:MAG: tRNA (adenosine(37)-N6)-dimethylallyltransferase MiaA [Alphaproteobacteria bacterium]|nr:tRNA (adenosine(37)-N6)-dimethylallyltransferase MiaA [Alphaproteobacteria bacterium]